MKFEYLKIWLRWYWLPYKEETVLDVSFRWLCFEALMKRQPTQAAPDAGRAEVASGQVIPPAQVS